MTTTLENSASNESAPIVLPAWLIGVTLGIAILTDMLLNGALPGVNCGLLGMAFFWCAIAITSTNTPGKTPASSKGLFLAAGLFSLLPTLRDTYSVQILSLAATVLCLLYGISIAHGFSWLATGIFEFPLRGLDAIRIMLFTGLRRPAAVSLPNAQSTITRTLPLVRGLLLAFPFLVIFGFLFSRADARFTQFVDFEFDLVRIFTHVGWLTLGALVSWFPLSALALRDQSLSPTKPVSNPPQTQFGAVEVITANAMILCMFLAFVVLQLGYLFGGTEYLFSTPDLTAADYAKQGFYELVAAATIALGTVYFFDWLTRDESKSLRRLLHWSIGGLLVLVSIVLVSAGHRMLVYVEMFGLTEERLFTLVFIGALAFLLIWTLVTVLGNQRERFASGLLLAVLLTVAVYGSINPHAIIAQVNLDRGLAGKSVDYKYLLTLSDDAVPAIIPLLSDTQTGKWKGVLVDRILESAERRQKHDWRSWSYSSYRASKAIEAMRSRETGAE